jgi:hypothetical protein
LVHPDDFSHLPDPFDYEESYAVSFIISCLGKTHFRLIQNKDKICSKEHKSRLY